MWTSKCTDFLPSLHSCYFRLISRILCHFFSDSVIYFQIHNPYQAAFGISNLYHSLIERAQTTLRHVVGARTVQSVVTEREAIALEIAEIVGDVVDKWGVAIESVLIKDIILSPEVSAYLSSALTRDSNKLLKQAADILAPESWGYILRLPIIQNVIRVVHIVGLFHPFLTSFLLSFSLHFT